ncbi:MAG: VIT family protein [Candidatus Obscuribacterales bacterium]|nr:VIT family protein [Candidatus Obscuribacterales bacterium]
MPKRSHNETHKMQSIGWLRAAVLGANDGIVSTASLVLGVSASGADHASILISGVAGLVAGAMSMAAGEYISVSSQSDTEKAALAQERRELDENIGGEHAELARIYISRGLEPALAEKVAEQLMAQDALGAHALDELGITASGMANPLQAALASAASFAAGAVLPLIVAIVAPPAMITPVIVVSALLSLALLGGLAAKIGGARVIPAVLRVTVWSALALALTYSVGHLAEGFVAKH